jgi:N-acetylmuramoyl-L-alanine amidase
MISFLAKNTSLLDRDGILRGVYEENLAILGKGRRPIVVRKSSLLNRSVKRVLLCTAVCVFLFLVNGEYRSDLSLSQVAANVKPKAGSGFSTSADRPRKEETLNASELKPLEGGGQVPLSRMLGLGVHRILIDAGHGGSDRGAVGRNGTLEKDITLDIARRLKARLIRSGFSFVRMTREDDSTVSLEERVASVQALKADLLVSVHVNWLPKTPVNVVETYYFGPSRDKGILKLAETENAGSEYGLSDFREILEKLGKTMKLQESRKLAESIQSDLYLDSSKQDPDIRNNGVKRAPFVVLLGPDVPSVLVEVSCLSSAKEERNLNSENHREGIAEALAAGIISYINKGVPQHVTAR